ncbi:NAD(P)-dependent oxidoreductase [Pseudonocardia xishanensis]|uniref:6-phosphogluconate dehydrogenase NADP-binding domain-containing protein n=1 Tax=Pseudonocardia xishanensis TaxID=630995 RepID=A0ABP8RVG2_9PSEU
MTDRHGFIGLGDLGLPMAERLADGGFLHAAWARSPERCAPLRTAGVAVADSPTDLGLRCDVVHVCVTDDDALVEVVDRLAPGLNPGDLVVVHSTVLPDACDEIAHRLAPRGVGVVDAPVCGGPVRARAGELLISCGGDDEQIDRCRPALEQLGRTVRRVGGLGSGERVKLAMNLLYAANVEIICQAMDFAEELGVPREIMSEFVRALPYDGFVGGPLATGHVGSSRVRHGARMLAKDVDYASRAAADAGADARDLLKLGTTAISSLADVADEVATPA